MASNWRSLYQANEDAINGNWYRISKVKFNYDEVVSYYPSSDGSMLLIAPGFAFSPDGSEPEVFANNLKWILRFKTSDMSFTQDGTKTKYGANGVVYSSADYCEINGSEVKITWVTPLFFYCWTNPQQAMGGNFNRGDLGIGRDMAKHIYVLPEGMEEESKTPAEELTENIQRIQIAKNNIKTAIENKYITVPEDARIDEYATYINQIPQDYTDAVPWHIVTANDACYWYDELTIGPEGGEVSLSATAYYDEHQYYGLVGDIKNLVYYRLKDGSTTSYVSTDTFSDLDSNQWNTDPVYSVKNKFIKFNIDPLPDDITERYMQFYIYYTNPANMTTSDKIIIWQRR